MMKFWLVISCGDPSGIGYELSLKSILWIRKNKFPFEPILVGNSAILKLVANKCSINLKPIKITSRIINYANYTNIATDRYLLIDILPEIDYKDISSYYPRITYLTLEETVYVIKNSMDKNTKFALLTMPVAKKNVQKFVHNFNGHTEFLQKKFNVEKNNISMLMEGKNKFNNNIYRVLMLTRHFPLKDISKHLKVDYIIKQVENVYNFVNRYESNKVKKIFFCNVNPHCGDNGLIGNEEKNVVEKTINMLRKRLKIKNIQLLFSADAFLKSDESTLIVSTYHDQAMVPLKLLCGYNVVNITVGLPFFRVSPGHGIAEDIVLQNKADISGVKLCIEKLKEFFKNAD